MSMKLWLRRFVLLPSTTLEHNSQTVTDDCYLDLVTRALLGASGKPEPAHLRTPAAVSAD